MSLAHISEENKYENNSYGLYKATFEKATLGLSISINKKNEIDGFLVKPLQDETTETQISNALSDKGGQITKEQLDIIYTKTKDFPNNTQIAIAVK